MNKPRLLKAEEIEVRIGTINEKGATLLLYKDARVDQHLLDETFGAENWQRDHKELKGNIYCGVGIREKISEETNFSDAKYGDWVWKWDAGTESQTEKVKGEASDSFKRACVNWGIGRELYTAPFTWISSDKYTPYKNPKTGKLATYDKFKVDEIDYTDGVITKLVISNTKSNAVVFSMGSTKQPAKTAPKPVTDDKPTKTQLDTIYNLASGMGMSDDEIRKAIAKVTTKDMADKSIKKLEEK